MQTGLPGLIVVSALITLVGVAFGQLQLIYIFKPLTTILIFVMALLAQGSPRRYKFAIATGLIFSLAGDVFLMLPTDQFLAGLVSFLLAHICYLVAFTTDTRFAERRGPFVNFALLSGLLMALLWDGIPQPMRIPVIVYVVLLGSMAAQSFVRRAKFPSLLTTMAALGGLLFVASDALIAIDRFSTGWSGSRILVLALYYAAQALIAKSADLRSGLVV